jgi:hypothetical protein
MDIQPDVNQTENQILDETQPLLIPEYHGNIDNNLNNPDNIHDVYDNEIDDIFLNRNTQNAINKIKTDVYTKISDRINNFFNKKNARKNIIDSLTLTDNVKKSFEILDDETYNPEEKIKICQYLCSKLYHMYRLSEYQRKIIIEKLSDIVYNGEDIILPIRLIYLSFLNEYISYNTSIQLYEMSIRDRLEHVSYFQILNYILRGSLDVSSSDGQHKRNVYDELERYFADENTSLFEKMQIADIFILTNERRNRGNEMLDYIRAQEDIIMLNRVENQNNIIDTRFDTHITIYKDSQNVHTSDINDSVRKACVCLMEFEKPDEFDGDQVINILTEISPKLHNDIKTVIYRIQIDTSRFTYKNNMFNLYNVFSSLWIYINKHRYKDELLNRLIEEIVQMNAYCSTGHLSRLINVIQGYTDSNTNLDINIGEYHQIRSVVFHYIEKSLKNNPDILDHILENETKYKFYEFIRDNMNSYMSNILDEYGDVSKHILESVKAYTKISSWKLSDNRLILSE